MEILKGLFDYTDEELVRQSHFDLLAACALGQDGLGKLTVCIRTIYYNRERLPVYEAMTGRNLLEEEFNNITDDALEQLGVDTKTQRIDSSFVGSFIKKMSRLEIAVTVLQNFCKELSEGEQERWHPPLSEYLKEEARHLSFRLKRVEVEAHLTRVGEWLFKLHEAYSQDKDITGLQGYQHMGRMLQEQYRVTKDKKDKGRTVIEVKSEKEISASSLQNPADDTATFRRKGRKEHQGYVLNVEETCSPDNPVQLLTDASLYPNVISDKVIAIERVPEIKKRMDVRDE